ncbi:MAG: carboxypeptidase regulatory-like domain-containing protein [Candidatus Aminicenantales bacterium]
MRKFLTVLCVFAFAALFLCGMAFAQSKENGAIEGKVTFDDQPMPGVEVTLSSAQLIGGIQSVITTSAGKFRFVALPPGSYDLEAKLQGFSTARKEGIRLSVSTTLTVDFVLEVGKIEETVVVRGVLPMVDVKDSQTAVTTLTKELIQNIPNNQFSSNIVNLAPGVSGDSAFGASDNGVQYQIDGVDVSDPELHTAYVFLDYGVVEESKIMGIGAPAEYDGFTGIVFNIVTKSGGNNFSGMFDSWLQLKKWNSSNTDDPYLTPAFAAYYNVHFDMGGPIVKDKLWFFGGAQYYRSETTATGFPYATAYDQPRFFLKLTWQASKADRVNLSLEQDWYQGKYRQASKYRTPDATRDQDSPEFYFNFGLLHVFSEKTFFEAKFAGFISKYLLMPHMGYDLPGHYDYNTLMYTVNYSTYYHAYRNRYSFNASLSHHAEDFIKGSHDFKFGIDGEINPTRTEYGYPGNIRYYDRDGQPYRAAQYEGYSTKATNYRMSAYIMDSWALSDKIKINPGIRFNYYRGNLDAVGTVFKPQIGIAPRIGITYDIFGDHSTALKFHYGKYYDNIITYLYTALAPKPDYIALGYDSTAGTWYERYTIPWENLYSIDDTIRMPYMHQFTVGLEREVTRDLSVAVNYIYRTNKDMIDRVNLTGGFEAMQYYDEFSGKTITVYNQINPGEDKYIITNIKKGKYPIIPFEPSRKYSGVEFVINKRFSNNWQVLASYVYGKATGNNDNYYGASNNSSLGVSDMFTDPNYQINAEGRLSFDPTHMLKIQGSIILPFDINVASYFLYISGNPWTPQIVAPLDQADIYVNAEPLGSRRLPAQTRLDLRVEKILRFGQNMRVGVTVEVFNIFNAGTTTWVTTEYSSDFGLTGGIVRPRAFRTGLRFFF